MRYFGLLFFFILSFGISLSAQAEKDNSFWAKSADVTILDGDTLIIDSKVVKLSGIQAPEIGQNCDHNGHLWSCGMSAALDLHKIMAMARLERLHCWVTATQLNWTEATCYIGEKDIAAAMIATGTVHAEGRASLHYRMLQQDVRDGGIGIWGSYVEPRDLWLKKVRSTQNKSSCSYKGITGKSGTKWFASPLLKGFQHLKGEEVFCTIEDALEQGFIPLSDIQQIK